MQTLPPFGEAASAFLKMNHSEGHSLLDA